MFVEISICCCEQIYAFYGGYEQIRGLRLAAKREHIELVILGKMKNAIQLNTITPHENLQPTRGIQQPAH